MVAMAMKQSTVFYQWVLSIWIYYPSLFRNIVCKNKWFADHQRIQFPWNTNSSEPIIQNRIDLKLIFVALPGVFVSLIFNWISPFSSEINRLTESSIFAHETMQTKHNRKELAMNQRQESAYTTLIYVYNSSYKTKLTKKINYKSDAIN